MFVKKDRFIEALQKYLDEQGLTMNKSHKVFKSKDTVIQIKDDQAVLLGLKKGQDNE